MLGYIIRRLLLMIPTLFGITFLVFMLLALAPGGIGASLRAAGGEVDADSKASLQLLYIEDRYGLDDNAVTQYFRWLGKISPVKVGTRALRNYADDLELPPRVVKDLPADMALFGEGMSLSPEEFDRIEKDNAIVADDVTEARVAAVEEAWLSRVNVRTRGLRSVRIRPPFPSSRMQTRPTHALVRSICSQREPWAGPSPGTRPKTPDGLSPRVGTSWSPRESILTSRNARPPDPSNPTTPRPLGRTTSSTTECSRSSLPTSPCRPGIPFAKPHGTRS